MGDYGLLDCGPGEAQIVGFLSAILSFFLSVPALAIIVVFVREYEPIGLVNQHSPYVSTVNSNNHFAAY